MWLGLSESVQIYLGQGLAFLRQGKQPVQAISHPATWGLERVLANLAQALSPSGVARRMHRTRRFHVTLGAVYCPARGLSVPQGVHRWAELYSIAQASLDTHGAGQNTLCELDPRNTGVAAGMGSHVKEALDMWATDQGGSLASIRPLWSTASECKAAKPGRVRGMAIAEPGALTLLAQNTDGVLDGVTLTVVMDEQQEQMQLRRWRVSHGLEQGAWVGLRLGADVRDNLPQGPTVWTGHWSAL